MNICSQGRLARAPNLQFLRPFQFRDICRDSTNRIRPRCAIPQQKLNHDVLSLALRHWYGFLKLDWCVRFDHMPIVRSQPFGNITWKNVKVSFSRGFGHAGLDGDVRIRGSLDCSEAQDP